MPVYVQPQAVKVRVDRLEKINSILNQTNDRHAAKANLIVLQMLLDAGKEVDECLTR